MRKIFRVTCNEPKGDVIRSVYEFEYTPESLMRLWELSKDLKTVFGEDVRGDFNKFCSIFLRMLPDGTVEGNGVVYLIDDFTGIFYMDEIYHPWDAKAHFIFFDLRLKGRVPLIKAMVDHIFTTYKFNRLSVEFPVYSSTAVLSLLKKVGFATEGRRKCTHSYDGKLWDSFMLGIVNPEVSNGS